MSKKIPLSQMISGLDSKGVYDFLTRRKLDTLNREVGQGAPIWEKERDLIRKVFSEKLEELETEGVLVFDPLFKWELNNPQGRVECEIERFLGYGNEGPVYSVRIKGRAFALKLYSAAELNYLTKAHGKFGLAGALLELHTDNRVSLSKMGRAALSKKEKGVYGRNGKIVEIHNIGLHKDLICLVMDLLEVDPISHLKPLQKGATQEDMITWAIDCAVGLCQLHLEEGRLHLNLRPEAFIKRTPLEGKRRPKYTFFNYPSTYKREPGSLGETIEFIMVDHMDNSVEWDDKEQKGMATFGSWLFMAPETILTTLKILREDYETYLEKGYEVSWPSTIRAPRNQMEDIWALGATLCQFLSDGNYPFGSPSSLGAMVNSILLTPLDLSPAPEPIRDILSRTLEKDPKKRLQRLMEGVPKEIIARRSAAEALLYRLEGISRIS
jgi:serine/threonine protein kinase